MNERGLGLDTSKRGRTLAVAVAISVVTLAGPAGAAPDRANDVSDSWTHVSVYSSTTFGRSWS